MRLHLGPVPDEFSPDSSWRAIREPDPILLQVIALPVAAFVAVLVGFAWSRVGLPTSLLFPGPFPVLVLFNVALALSIPALIVAHELLHAIVHPHFGLSSSTIIGAWPSRLLFYAHFSGPLTRNRFLAIFAMPFLVITVLPLAVAATGILSPTVKLWAAWFS